MPNELDKDSSLEGKESDKKSKHGEENSKYDNILAYGIAFLIFVFAFAIVISGLFT